MRINILLVGLSNENFALVDNLSHSILYEHSFFQSCSTIYEANDIIKSFGKFDMVFFNLQKLETEEIIFLEKLTCFNTFIVIISDTCKFAIESYKYSVYNYSLTEDFSSNICDILFKFQKYLAVSNVNLIDKVFYRKFLLISSVKKVEIVKVKDISYLEAEGRYTIIYLQDGTSKIATKNLGEFNKILDPEFFRRIHHKYIINLNCVINIHKSDGVYCEMINNKNLPVSKRKLDGLFTYLSV